MRKRLLLLTVAVAIAACGAVPVFAHQDGTDHQHERAGGRLDATRKRVCQQRSQRITNIMGTAATTGKRHIASFSISVERITQFVEKNNIAVPGYNALMSAVNTQKTEADAAASALAAATFDCNSDDPQGAISQFKANTQTMHIAIKEYRQSIKDLLAAVKDALQAQREGDSL